MAGQGRAASPPRRKRVPGERGLPHERSPRELGLSQEGTARLRSPLRVTHRRGCGDPGVQPLGAFADLVCTDVTVVRENKHKTFL